MLENKKVLVAYFSANGVTKFLAEEIADIVQGDLFEIKPQIPYTAADLIWTDKNSRTTIEMHDDSARPAFVGDVEHMDAYDIVFLGFPIWWYVAPHIIDTFLERYDFSGKTIIPFCTSGSSGIGSSAEDLETLCSDTAVWADGKRFSAGDVDALEEWLLGLPELEAYL